MELGSLINRILSRAPRTNELPESLEPILDLARTELSADLRRLANKVECKDYRQPEHACTRWAAHREWRDWA